MAAEGGACSEGAVLWLRVRGEGKALRWFKIIICGVPSFALQTAPWSQCCRSYFWTDGALETVGWFGLAGPSSSISKTVPGIGGNCGVNVLSGPTGRSDRL